MQETVIENSLALQLVEFAFMLVIDLIFILCLFLLMLPLGIWRQAAFAVMKRNFSGYFSNPTGYVFLCLFVLLTSFAAFWPHEFFTTNLANFDQLNKYLPYIMLVFIPAITMSIWAEERRQGTDELLLTLPAKDFDIVIGKYFAAVLVFTVSLLFSQLSNYAVLIAMTGGELDSMLLFSTYLGYWFMGIAMLALGMIASFLTNNLTVGFIFGAAFNAPLAFFSNADVIVSNGKWVQQLYEWSLLQRFEPFGRGLIALPGIFYFLGLVTLGIYLSLILIGRRHWLGGRDGTSMLWQYLFRAIFVTVIVASIVLIAQFSPLNHLRVDVSQGGVSTLSPSTVEVLNRLANAQPDSDGREPQVIKIDAFVSNNIPTEYVQAKNDLVNLLREFDVMGGNRVSVNLRQGIEPFSAEAINAEQRFGIRPTKVVSESRGAIREEDVVMGVAFASGRERVVIPFFPYGMPIEYELMRSINTVSRDERKTVGIVQSDALITGSVLSSQGQQIRIPRLKIVQELEKQFNVEIVQAQNPISLWIDDDSPSKSDSDVTPKKQRRYDVLLIVQPSKLNPNELDNLITAIQMGQPVVIFEDPLPSRDNFPHISPTLLPRTMARAGAGTADIQKLWDALDLDVDRVMRQIQTSETAVVQQDFPWVVWQLSSENPYPRDSTLDEPERVVIRDENRDVDALFSSHPVTEGIDELYFQYAGYIRPSGNSSLKFEPLVKTGNAGRILVHDWMNTSNSEQLRNNARGSANASYCIAAHITGSNATDAPGIGLEDNRQPPAKAMDSPSKENTNVIYVCDIDVLADLFVDSRNYPIRNGIQYRFQNMAFVLNAVDAMAGEDEYLGIRNRKERHVTLRVVENTTENAMGKVYQATQNFEKDFMIARNEIEQSLRSSLRPLEDQIRDMQARQARGERVDMMELTAKQQIKNQLEQEQVGKFQRLVEELENERRENLRSIQLDAELEIQEKQRNFKLAAVIIPPIPPLLVGLVVFTRRRLREREGISKARRLK
ncbi:MAG: Gldg family protein [Mariniblastus sp.]|nr:Gldg family protein [Mariniblastus sp.]